MHKVPSFVRAMARMAILRYAQERGHTVITARIVDEATASLMPGHAEAAMAEIVAADTSGELGRHRRDGEIRWSAEAQDLLQSIGDASPTTVAGVARGCEAHEDEAHPLFELELQQAESRLIQAVEAVFRWNSTQRAV